MKTFIYTIALIFIYSNLVLGQTQPELTLKIGNGYLGDIHNKIKNQDENPKSNKTLHGSAVFYDLSYHMSNNYILGIKYMKGEGEKPYNDSQLKDFINSSNYLWTYNSYEMHFSYNYKYKKNKIIVGVGPVVILRKEAYYEGIVNKIYTDEWGMKYGELSLNSSVVSNRLLKDIGINPKIDYEYMVNPKIALGIKAEAYFVAYMGFSYLFISPTIMFKY